MKRIITALIAILLLTVPCSAQHVADSIAATEHVSVLQRVEDWYSDNMNYASITALMAIEKIAKESQRSPEDVLVDFMKSNTAKMLYDDSNKLWWDGPDATAEEFKQETI